MLWSIAISMAYGRIVWNSDLNLDIDHKNSYSSLDLYSLLLIFPDKRGFLSILCASAWIFSFLTNLPETHILGTKLNFLLKKLDILYHISYF